MATRARQGLERGTSKGCIVTDEKKPRSNVVKFVQANPKPPKPKRKPEPDDFRRGDHVELGQRLVATVTKDSAAVYDEGRIYRFDTPIWTAVEHVELSRIVQSFAGLKIQSSEEATPKPLKIRANDVAGAIELAGHAIAKRDFFSSAPNGLMFKNGFVRTTAEGTTIEPYSVEHRARFAYPFDFDPTACPARFLQCLNDAFRDDEDRKEKIATSQEFFGACLLGVAPKYQQCLVLTGEGQNGKSTVLEIIEAAFPAEQRIAIPPQDWGDEYRKALMAGKRLNCVNELPDREIISSEDFKVIITGESITARPIRQAPFTYRPSAGHVFACNRLPGTTDQTKAFWRRFIVLTYNRVFAPHERVVDLAKSIIREELPAIVAWLVHGAVRILGRNGYTIPASHGQAIANWQKNADVVRLFLDEQTKPLQSWEQPTGGTPPKEVFDSFKSWASKNNHKPMANNVFGERLSKIVPQVWTHDGRRYPFRLADDWRDYEESPLDPETF